MRVQKDQIISSSDLVFSSQDFTQRKKMKRLPALQGYMSLNRKNEWKHMHDLDHLLSLARPTLQSRWFKKLKYEMFSICFTVK